MTKTRERQGVHFLKIQKTGGTTFGEKVLGKFCRDPEWCWGGTHMEYNEATGWGKFTGRVVTLLRDPVERAISEFFYLRDVDGQNSATQPQWDFRNMTWAKSLLDRNLSRAFDNFVHGYPKNPSRNRQALYVLGFRNLDRVENLRQDPGKVYDWDANPQELVNRALANLDKLAAFGITDCWVPSLRAIAQRLGWNASAVVQYGRGLHERYWRKAMVIVGKRRDEGRRGISDWKKLVQLTGKEIPEDTPWKTVLPQKYVEEIERWQNVDMPLYKAAKQLFEKKFGQRCG